MLTRHAALAASLALFLIAAQPARAQRGGFYVRAYPSYGGFPGFYPFYGYDGFYSNGFSMYGPPVPTYGSVPGVFGGADQRLSNFNNSWPAAAPRHRHIQPLPPELDQQVTEIPLPQPDELHAPAYIDIRVPLSSAQVWIDGERTAQAGLQRTFRSPPLEKGKQYQYEIEVRWSQDGQAQSRTETLTVEAGKRFQVDFRPPELLPEGAAPKP